MAIPISLLFHTACNIPGPMLVSSSRVLAYHSCPADSVLLLLKPVTMLPPPLVSIVLTVALVASSNTRAAADSKLEFFESAIRPVLIQQCSECHGAHKQSGGLRVDSLSALLKGGDSGPAIIMGNAGDSLLIQAIQRSEELAMPPDESLAQRQLDAFTYWVNDGAAWPEGLMQLESVKDSGWKQHWAFQQIQPQAIPKIDNDWIQTPIDAFILQRLTSNGLQHSSEADPRTLMRRATYGLTGLPPTPEDIEAFVANDSFEAWSQVVDRLLKSPQYGEQWARHWLDVARYADTKGYVYGREERFWIHAWAYRDWVVRALNQDIAYDRFLQLQIAADQVEDSRPEDMAAMGFLTLGRRFLGIKHDIIDDRIDVVCRSTMGLTVACARCHDHKYDPIPTADYYSLYGVFDSCYERVVAIGDQSSMDETFATELLKRQTTLTDARQKVCDQASQRHRDRIQEYLIAQTDLAKYPQAGFDQIIPPSDIHPRVVHRWNRWLHNAGRRHDRVFRAWDEFRRLPEDSFADDAVKVTEQLSKLPPADLNPIVAAQFNEAPSSFGDVARRYGELLNRINEKWKTEVEVATGSKAVPPQKLSDPAEEQLRQSMYGPSSPCTIPDVHISNIETLLASGEVTQLWKHQGEVDRWIIQSQHDLPHALTLADRPAPVEPRIFRRGNPRNVGDSVSRHFLTLFSDGFGPAADFRSGSGRRELADAIISPDNPLTARVIVNRVWAQHFGRGLVASPSDFGLRADEPSHPELLDWLAGWFMENGWQLKPLHRLIMTSSVYQQASEGLQEATFQGALEMDPANRLLWRMTPHRLTFEEFRDSLLRASGELQSISGGKPFDLFAADAAPRRTIYGLVDRQYLPGALRTFDFPNPDLHIAQRSQTTVPQQALFFMNHELVLKQVRLLTTATENTQDSTSRVRQLFRRILQRDPTPSEISEALSLIDSVGSKKKDAVSAAAADWSYGYGEVDETGRKVINFEAAPHFTGSAWQGGPKWPDAKLGWVNLTAVGGHPGNTRKHACVRRWTAPRDMKIRIASTFVHEPAVGDGVRVFMLAAEEGLYAGNVHQNTIEVNADEVQIAKGAVVDFVVDIDQALNSDQFQWRIVITDTSVFADGHSVWDSKEDFTRNSISPLTPWQQLTHVLICTNEFMFVD